MKNWEFEHNRYSLDATLRPTWIMREFDFYSGVRGLFHLLWDSSYVCITALLWDQPCSYNHCFLSFQGGRLFQTQFFLGSFQQEKLLWSRSEETWKREITDRMESKFIEHGRKLWENLWHGGWKLQSHLVWGGVSIEWTSMGFSGSQNIGKFAGKWMEK